MVEPKGLEVAADWRTLRSPETYLGHRQTTGFAQDDVARFDAPHEYAARTRLPLNSWALAGTASESVTNATIAVSVRPAVVDPRRLRARGAIPILGMVPPLPWN